MIKTFDEFLALYCHLNALFPNEQLEEVLSEQLSKIQQTIPDIGKIEAYYMIIIGTDIKRILNECIRDNSPININICANIITWLKRYKDQNILENVEIDLKEKGYEDVQIIVNIKFKNYKDTLKLSNILRGIRK